MRIFFYSLAFFLFMAGSASAGEIAIVNVQSIVKNSLASKDIQAQLEKKRGEYQKEIDKQEAKLRKEDEELSKQRNILSKEAYEEKVKAFRKEVETVQKGVQQKRGQLDKAYANALMEVQKVTVQIISEMSAKQGFSVAVPSEQILFAKDGLDISKDVLSELDKRLTKVAVKIEEKA
jgi:outer membrane protein